MPCASPAEHSGMLVVCHAPDRVSPCTCIQPCTSKGPVGLLMLLTVGMALAATLLACDAGNTQISALAPLLCAGHLPCLLLLQVSYRTSSNCHCRPAAAEYGRMQSRQHQQTCLTVTVYCCARSATPAACICFTV